MPPCASETINGAQKRRFLESGHQVIAADRLSTIILRNVLGLYGSLVSSRLSILIFHRVHAQIDPLFPHEPDAARFDAMMCYVAATFRVLTLGEAVSRLEQGTLPARSLVITFDDGYADNADVALPILQKHGLRATFFISTGFLDGGRMWNDSVIECLRASPLDAIDLEYPGLGPCPMRTVDDRRNTIDRLLPHIKYLTLSGREEAIARLQALCRVNALPDELMMTSEQVQGLHRAGMEIGAHTVNHPILTSLTPQEAESEIRAGRMQLQEIIAAPVDVFAYPNGKPDQDYADCHVEMVRKQGFRGAVSTAPGVGKTGDDLFQLPRFTPWGKSLSVWGARLALNQRNTRYAKAATEASVPSA